MATKSGRVKLEDLRQGKTVWLAFANPDTWALEPKPYLVVDGVRQRFAGVRMDERSMPCTYTLPTYALDARYSGKDPSGTFRSILFSFFHPSRNKNIEELPDGSLAQINAFTTRRACARYCAQRNAERQDSVSDVVFTPHVKYTPTYADPTAGYATGV